MADMEHGGSTQIRTWIPDDQYGVIREMAAGKHVSISQVVRDLIGTGLTCDAARGAGDLLAKQLEGAVATLRAAVTEAAKPVSQSADNIGSALDHLERLMFFVAQTAAFISVINESTIEQQLRRLRPDPDAADDLVNSWRGKHIKIAEERVSKSLRGPKPKLEAGEG